MSQRGASRVVTIPRVVESRPPLRSQLAELYFKYNQIPHYWTIALKFYDVIYLSMSARDPDPEKLCNLPKCI